MLHYDAILFDVDGTLWDSAAQVAESWNEVLSRYPRLGVRITAQDMYDNMGKTMMDIGKTLFPGLSQEECRKVMEECMTYENHYLLSHPGVLYPETREIMACLSRQYGLYIVSNCQDGYIQVAELERVCWALGGSWIRGLLGRWLLAPRNPAPVPKGG